MAPRPEPLPPPVAWYVHQADTDHFTSQGEHCQARRCRHPIEVVSHRNFSSAGHVLLAEKFWCRQHGGEFAARWHTKIEAISDRPARHLAPGEALAAFAAGRECADPSCCRPVVVVFTEAYALRGEPG
jgi:hypothetical protein